MKTRYDWPSYREILSHAYECGRFKRSPFWPMILDYWDHRCAVCGREPSETFMLAPDHWQPFRGRDMGYEEAVERPLHIVAANMIPLCHARKGGSGACNNKKGNREPVEWLVVWLGEEKSQEKLAEIQLYFAWLKKEIGAT